jgi:hypothetical protein
MFTIEIVKPETLEIRLQVIPTPWKPVLEEAKAKNMNVRYTSQDTPFGTFPIFVEIEN